MVTSVFGGHTATRYPINQAERVNPHYPGALGGLALLVGGPETIHPKNCPPHADAFPVKTKGGLTREVDARRRQGLEPLPRCSIGYPITATFSKPATKVGGHRRYSNILDDH